MNRFYFWLLMTGCLITGNSCRYSKDYVTPPPDLPAPFSSKPAAVQLSETYGGSDFLEKFRYEKGYLVEHQYIQYLDRPYQAIYYKRQSGVLSSIARWQAQWYPESLYSETLDYKSTLTFQSPQGDSLRKVILSKPGEVSEFRYSIDKEGFLMRVWDVEKGDNTFFERNKQHNISVSRRYVNLYNAELITTTYEYDDHPNPFFAIGRIADASVDTSPNNIVRSVSRSGNYVSTTTCQYTYRSDGYPEKAIVKRSSNNVEEKETVNTIVYKYN